MITSDNLTFHELIGLHTEICKSTNPQIIGLNGPIINETKSMITIQTQKGEKIIAKSNNHWKFSVNDQVIIIDGSTIDKRPFDRKGGRS